MVILHLKKTDLNQFLYETYCGIKCEDLLNELCESKSPFIAPLGFACIHIKYAKMFSLTLSLIIVNNLRLKLDRAAISLEDLATKGPLKPEELRGLKDYDEYVKNEDITTINGLKKMPPKFCVREVVEDSHYRTGWLIAEEMC
jgi:hypothetical protein